MWRKKSVALEFRIARPNIRLATKDVELIAWIEIQELIRMARFGTKNARLIVSKCRTCGKY